jgi:hypothetical protein
MKRHLFGLSLALATIALFGFARSAPAQDPDQFKLSGTVTERVLLGFTENTYTVQITVYGEGTVGAYEEISVVTFTYLGDATWAYEDETTIYILNEKGKRTGDEIYIEGFGISADGRFVITGGKGLYEGASGNGAFHFNVPVATFTGVIK